MEEMRIRWRARWRFRKAATALLALALLPVAFLVASTHAQAAAVHSPLGAGVHADTLGAQDIDLPTKEALQRSEASKLFAPFAWDGEVVSGPFVAFDFSARTGAIVGYFAVNGTNMSLLVDTVQIAGFVPASAPLISGATFSASGSAVSLVVHDEPMALLEIRSQGQARTVVLQFPSGTKDLTVAQSAGWPHSSLAFSVGGNRGRVILGRGNLSINGTTVTAGLQAEDYLALRAVPAFAEHAPERSAVLEAFASGRLAAEYDLVAMSSGGWLENSAQYQLGLAASSSRVEFNQAEIDLGATGPRSGLVILAFDPQTMPSDDHHRLVVTENGLDVPQVSDPVQSLYALPGTSGRASFALLGMNATVLVVYLPDLSATPLQIESLALPAGGLDWPTELAMVAAAFVVSVAAAIMFRRTEP
jgi:hypothetical protein